MGRHRPSTTVRLLHPALYRPPQTGTREHTHSKLTQPHGLDTSRERTTRPETQQLHTQPERAPRQQDRHTQGVHPFPSRPARTRGIAKYPPDALYPRFTRMNMRPPVIEPGPQEVPYVVV